MVTRKRLNKEEFDRIKYVVKQFPNFKTSDLSRLFKRGDNLIRLVKESETLEEYQAKSRAENQKYMTKNEVQDEQPTPEETQMLQETADALTIKKIEERLGRIERILILIARSTNAITNS
ncbi:hypothetical protein KBC79_01520 [Candidatus Woesebacteria bacterium]|nr:hypothetical protein [Candidatus Woesebacteria bacterium]